MARRRPARRLGTLAAGLALLGAACGGSASPSGEVGAGTSAEPSSTTAAAVAASTTSTGAAGEAATSAFPSLAVTDVYTGATLDLRTELAGGDEPVLLWFWAPH